MKDEIRLLEDDDYDLDDTVAPEYDIEAIRKQARLEGREYRGIFSGKSVRLAPDVAEVFDSSDAVNEALRTVIRVMRNADSKAA